MVAYNAAGGPPPARTGSQVPVPIQVDFAGPAPQSRLTVLVRILVVIPQLIVVAVLSIAAWVVTIIGWFAALFTGQLPGFAADFLTGFLRWQTRVFAYAVLLTDAYPPFTLDDADYPVRIATAPGQLNRLAVLFRFFLLIPCYIVQSVLSYGAFTIFQLVSWVIVLITGQMPDAVYEALAAAVRYQARVTGFALMLTSAYPAGLFGDTPGQFDMAGYGGQPGYGNQPGYDTPGGYGSQPGYGNQPGYGGQVAPVGYGAAALAGPARPLVLSSPARKLVAVFLVLGVLVAVGNGAVEAATVGHGVSAAVAADQVQADAQPVSSAISNYSANVKKCNGQLACVSKLDRNVAATFSTFSGQLRSTPMPSQAAPASSALATAVGNTAAIFSRLGSATSTTQYLSLAGQANLNTSLNQVNQDYDNLGKALNS